MPLHELELLAPAGKMNVLHSVVAAGADAVYLGGKRFNMRALKAEFNFTDDELKYAADFVHKNNRKLYITVNNLYDGREIDEIDNYLLFLNDLDIDALIVQDLGIADVCAELNLDIPLHASVQMGISNLEAVKILEEKGFERVILSKNVSLPETALISGGTKLGIEFFIHGDLCISHTGQCYMSSFVGGESGNQGRCRKPCRWRYELQGAQEDEFAGLRHYLAHKDLCLYPCLDQLIEAGISSFKIEGRMRSAEYLSRLVSIYRRALNRLIEDPAAYRTDEKEMLDLQELRIRDYTEGNLLKPLDWTVVGFDGQREPSFISKTAQQLSRSQLMDPVDNPPILSNQITPEITVKIGGLDSLEAIRESGVNNVILGCDIIRQNRQNWTTSAILEASEMLQGSPLKIFLETPRIVSQYDLSTIHEIKQIADSAHIWGVIVNDLGSLNIFRDSGLQIWGGYGLNTFNHNAAAFLNSLGISRITASLEMKADNLKSMLNSGSPTEVMVHGPLPCLVSDFCIIRSAQSERDGECPMYCLQDKYSLKDNWGQRYRINTDANCRNYLFFPYDLCLLQYMPHLSCWGAQSFRIEGQYYDPRQLKQVVEVYRAAVQQLTRGEWEPSDNYRRMLDLFPEGLTTALLNATQQQI
ncbi:MAG: U32 family peptidase [Syntrophomonas sp.]